MMRELADNILDIAQNSISARASLVEIDITVDHSRNDVSLRFADDGCGIREDRLKSIFTGNYDTHAVSSDTKKRNIGIGLSVCATIIKAHNGEISAENRKSGGAVFRFTLDQEEMTDYEQ